MRTQIDMTTSVCKASAYRLAKIYVQHFYMQTQKVTIHTCLSSYPQHVFVLSSEGEEQSCSVSLFVPGKKKLCFSYDCVIGEKEITR